jgi:DNA-directed RNA polymerase sigma subunit (sigma70/sigma32)
LQRSDGRETHESFRGHAKVPGDWPVEIPAGDGLKYPLTRDDQIRLAPQIERATRAPGSARKAIGPSATNEPELCRAVTREGLPGTFVPSNLRLVVSTPTRASFRECAALDLIQEGNLGALHAV